MARVLDLLGDPIPDNHGGRGRPPHMPTDQNRNRVSFLVARGWSNERIAGAMLISLPTLRRHYFSELNRRAVERDRVEARLGFMLWEQSNAGNVGAMREVRRMLDRDYEMQYGQQRGASDPAPAPAEYRGKKEAAVHAAHNPDVGTPLGELIAARQQRHFDS